MLHIGILVIYGDITHMKSVKINKKKMIYLMTVMAVIVSLGSVMAYLMSQSVEQTTVVLQRSDMVTLSIEDPLASAVFLDEISTAEFLVTENTEIDSLVLHINISSETDYANTNGLCIGWKIYDNTHTQVGSTVDPTNFGTLTSGSLIFTTSSITYLNVAGLDFCYIELLIEIGTIDTGAYQFPGEIMTLTVWAENS